MKMARPGILAFPVSGLTGGAGVVPFASTGDRDRGMTWRVGGLEGLGALNHPNLTVLVNCWPLQGCSLHIALKFAVLVVALTCK